jgi:hypothetical protein
MQVEVLSVSVEEKGKYKMAEVAYKGGDGKVTSKKLMSFNHPEVFKTFADAKQGAVFQVESQKNDKGYWDWISASIGGAVAKASPTTGNASPKSTYETAEERANRQVLIVRQSSLSNAVEFLGLNTKKIPSVQEVVEVATFFENYVFGKTSSPSADVMEDLESDII